MTIARRLMLLLAVPLVILVALGVLSLVEFARIESRSRFVAESNIAAFDVVSPPPDASPGCAQDVPAPRIDLKQAMRNMWMA